MSWKKVAHDGIGVLVCIVLGVLALNQTDKFKGSYTDPLIWATIAAMFLFGYNCVLVPLARRFGWRWV